MISLGLTFKNSAYNAKFDAFLPKMPKKWKMCDLKSSPKDCYLWAKRQKTEDFQ